MQFSVSNASFSGGILCCSARLLCKIDFQAHDNAIQNDGRRKGLQPKKIQSDLKQKALPKFKSEVATMSKAGCSTKLPRLYIQSY